MGLSFVIGLGQLVGVTYLPLYLQAVTGVSATNSGLLLLPLLGGMIIVSAATGQLISRCGTPPGCSRSSGAGHRRDRVLPLFDHDARDGEFTTVAVFMFVTGIGLGFINPVISLSAQLAVDRTRIGVATTSVSVTRSLGAGVGVAVLGSVFTTTRERSHEQTRPPSLEIRGGEHGALTRCVRFRLHIQQVSYPRALRQSHEDVPLDGSGYRRRVSDSAGPSRIRTWTNRVLLPQGTPKDSTATSDGPPGEETPTND